MKVKDRLISELKPAEYNPRKSNAKQRADLLESMRKYGFQVPALININPDRKDIIIGGHLRIEIWKELGNKKCPCVELNLSLDEERELNIRLNKNTGDFDADLLAKFFESEELLLYGFNTSELPSVDELDDTPPESDEIIHDEPLYPVVPKFNEEYSMFCIMCSNELDATWLRNFLGIDRQVSYKNSHIAPSFVTTCEDFKKAVVANANIVSDDDGELEVMQ